MELPEMVWPHAGARFRRFATSGFAFDETSLKVMEAGICEEVVDTEPVGGGDEFGPMVGSLTCFTRIAGARKETTIRHIWYYGGKVVLDQALPVKSASWRTWSEKDIPPDWKGPWRVEVKAEDGTILETLRFTLR